MRVNMRTQSVRALVVVGAVVALRATLAAQSGTMERRTATFANNSAQTMRFDVPSLLVADPNNPPNTTLVLEFGKDGSSTVVDPGLGTGIGFTLKLGPTPPSGGTYTPSATLPFTTSTMPSANTSAFSGKQVTMTRPDALNTPGLFVLNLVHTQSTSANETWELDVSGLPVGSSPTVRGNVSLFGAQTGFSLLDPVGTCGGATQCPPTACKPGEHCTSDFITKLPRWFEEVVVLPWPWGPPPPPDCPVCGNWSSPVAGGFIRTLLSATPVDRSGALLGPGHAGEVVFNIAGGTPVGRVVDLGAGEYVQAVDYRRGDPPRVSVSAAGVNSKEMLAGYANGSGRSSGTSRYLAWIFGILLLLAVIVIARQRGAAVRG